MTNNQQPTTNNRKGILLVNLGSPKSTKVEDVKEYLDEFPMDERVIDYRWFFRSLLVQGIILRTAVVKDGVMHVTAGAGIVADSDPAAEQAETDVKISAMRQALFGG